METIYDIIIIGGGPAGMTAALYACRQNKKVLLLEKDFFGGQASRSPHIENFPGFDGTGEELMSQFRSSLRKLINFNAKFEEVIKVQLDFNTMNWQIVTKEDIYLTRSVILATGLQHKTLGLSNEEQLVQDGVLSYCTICDGKFFEGGITAVIGDSFTAAQYALDLSQYCRRVYILALYDKLFCEDSMKERIEKTKNIEVIYNYNTTKIDYITGSNNQLVGLFNENTRKYDVIVNGVFVAIGMKSNIDSHLFADYIVVSNDVINSQGLITVHSSVYTGLEGIFAAGDCTNNDRPHQVVIAASEGAMAALSAIEFLNTYDSVKATLDAIAAEGEVTDES